MHHSRTCPSALLMVPLAKTGVGRQLRSVGGYSDVFQKILPVEMLERIVQEVLLSQSHAFSSISALSTVSHQFRFIALRAFFSRLTVHRLSKASRIGNIPNSYAWVR
jgi:hypothetical protein